MPYPIRRLWNLAAVGGAIAVGIITHDAGFVVITLLGGLALPRILGFRSRRFGAWPGGWGPGRGAGWGPGCGGRAAFRGHMEQRMADWHSQAHRAAAPLPHDPATVA